MQGHDAYPDPSASSPGAHDNGTTATTVDTSVSALKPYTPPERSPRPAPRGPLRHPLQHGPAAGGTVPDHHDRPVRGRARGGVSGQLHPVRYLPDRVASHRRALDQPGLRRGDTAQGTRKGPARTVNPTATRSWARTGGWAPLPVGQPDTNPIVQPFSRRLFHPVLPRPSYHAATGIVPSSSSTCSTPPEPIERYRGE